MYGSISATSTTDSYSELLQFCKIFFI